MWAVAIVVLVGSVLTVLVRGRTPDAAVEAETVEVVRRTFASKRPLADEQFETDGIDLFFEKIITTRLKYLKKKSEMPIKTLTKKHLRL